MRIIGVIDVLANQVVAARAGKRSEYQPIRSPLCDDSTPASVARAFAANCGVREFYVADLNSLQGQPANHAAWQAVAKTADVVWIDSGVRTADELLLLQNALTKLDVNNARVICASESWQSEPLTVEMPTDEVAFSVDLRNGNLVSPVASRQATDPIDFLKQLMEAGWRRFIILDVAVVGTSQGCPTAGLCRAARDLSSDIEIITGGGIRHSEDLRRLEDAGCDAVLVSTALHHGGLRGNGHPKATNT